MQHEKRGGERLTNVPAPQTSKLHPAAEASTHDTGSLSLTGAYASACRTYAHLATLGLLSELVVDVLAESVREAA